MKHNKLLVMDNYFFVFSLVLIAVISFMHVLVFPFLVISAVCWSYFLRKNDVGGGKNNGRSNKDP